jgi:hypothetical protein
MDVQRCRQKNEKILGGLDGDLEPGQKILLISIHLRTFGIYCTRTYTRGWINQGLKRVLLRHCKRSGRKLKWSMSISYMIVCQGELKAGIAARQGTTKY